MAGPEDFVQIIHPSNGSVATVPATSLGHHYAAGWRLLTGSDIPEQEPAAEPEPVTRAQAAKAAKASNTTEEK